MKLSEAILLGSIGTVQHYGGLTNSKGGTCALGAAYIAIGAEIIAEADIPMSEPVIWGWAFKYKYGSQKCPECHVAAGSIATAIVHLNDKHKWTRPAIAQWVASMEPKEVEQTHVQGQAETLETLPALTSCG